MRNVAITLFGIGTALLAGQSSAEPKGSLEIQASPDYADFVHAIASVTALAETPQGDYAPAAGPVKALLYGPSEEIRRHLEELSGSIEYQQLAYRAPGEKRDRKLIVGVSGDIANSQVQALLDAVRIHDWWKFRTDPWRLFIHGDVRYARITLTDLANDRCPMIWYVINDSGNWVVFDGPGTPSDFPEICDAPILPPEITTDQ